MHRASGREGARLGTALGTPMPSSLWAGRGIGPFFCFGSLLESELGPSLRLQGARSSQLKRGQCFQGRCTQPEEDRQPITVSFSPPLWISFTKRQSSGCPQHQHLQLCWDTVGPCVPLHHFSDSWKDKAIHQHSHSQEESPATPDLHHSVLPNPVAIYSSMRWHWSQSCLLHLFPFPLLSCARGHLSSALRHPDLVLLTSRDETAPQWCHQQQFTLVTHPVPRTHSTLL